MKNYIFCSQINDEIAMSFKEEFLNRYGVDIYAEKYQQYNNILDRWDAITQYIFGKQDNQSAELYIEQFVRMLLELAYGSPDDIIRGETETNQIKQERLRQLKQLINSMINLVENYNLIASDVYLNACLSIKYIREKRVKRSEEELEKRKGILLIDEGCKATARNIEFTIPFRSYDKNNLFCLQYLKGVLTGTNVKIFGTNLTGLKEKSFKKSECMFDQRIELKFPSDRDKKEKAKYKRYGCWSQEKILMLENKKAFKVEDIYKVIIFYQKLQFSLKYV